MDFHRSPFENLIVGFSTQQPFQSRWDFCCAIQFGILLTLCISPWLAHFHACIYFFVFVQLHVYFLFMSNS